jgi:acetyl esterase/lipase
VGPETPPVFIAHAEDDPIVNVGSSLALFDALRGQHVPAELHVFDHGGHGWGLGAPGTRVGNWPALFAGWIAGRGFLPAATVPASGTAPAPLPGEAAGDDGDDDDN